MVLQKYESRFIAGEKLAEFIETENESLKDHILDNSNQYFCYAIPNGGVSVTEGFCSKYNLNYDILIVRKIKIPYNTEAGFGAVTTDGTILINEPLLNQLNLSEKEINQSINLTKEEINERLKFYGKESLSEDLYEDGIHNKSIFLLDDGLASGFTMLAAINMIQKYNPNKIFIAVPTAPLRTILTVKSKVDYIFCPNIRDVLWFAVADAYKHWYDVPESEVLKIITNSKYYKFTIGTPSY
ncbi:MAG: phosphoribosyltransferase [Candidatus Hermodarchaeota archaeon]